MITLREVESVAIGVFNAVTDVNDASSKLRMKTITDLYASMLANKMDKIDERTFDEGTAKLVGFFLKRDLQPREEAAMPS